MTAATISLRLARDQAERQASVLDKLDPSWADKINLGILDMTSKANCIAGQLGMVQFDWRWIALGTGIRSADDLKDAWSKVINGRRRA